MLALYAAENWKPHHAAVSIRHLQDQVGVLVETTTDEVVSFDRKAVSKFYEK